MILHPWILSVQVMSLDVLEYLFGLYFVLSIPKFDALLYGSNRVLVKLQISTYFVMWLFSCLHLSTQP